MPDPETTEPPPADPVPSALRAVFDTAHYLSQNPAPEAEADPARHYHMGGWRDGLDPSPRFSTRFYLDHNADVAAAGIDPFHHFITWGRHEGRRPHPDARLWRYDKGPGQGHPHYRLVAAHIDPSFYIRQWPDLAHNDADPAAHYISFGWRQGLDPSAEFSTNFYLAHHPWLSDGVISPLVHFLERGQRAGSIPAAVHPVLTAEDPAARRALQRAVIGPHFDTAHYTALYGLLDDVLADPLGHYLDRGWKAGFDPAPWFCTRFYIDHHEAVIGYGIDPLTHYIIWGAAAGLRPDASAPAHSLSDLARKGSAVADRMLSTGLCAEPAGRVMPRASYNPASLDLHWVIPDFGIGGGGHMTIFRMVHWLEFFGHRCTIWIKSDQPVDPMESYERILKHYRFVKAQCRPLDDSFAEASGDGVIATSWDTARVVAAASGFKGRFYFVQDNEALFYPRGSRSLGAETSYDLPLACICAGAWLKSRMQERHGRWARSFDLSYDPEDFFPPAAARTNPVPRIAFYGRTATERRCVELGWMALEILAERGMTFEVDLFGSIETPPPMPFPVVQHGILGAVDLGMLFRAVDVGLCFSATNYSLIPQEMMATGLAVVELDVESTRATFPIGAVTKARPDPQAIADALASLITSAQTRAQQGAQGQAYVERTSWESSARSVESALRDYLAETGWRAEELGTPAVQSTGPIKASIIVPTLDGGTIWKRVAHAIGAQKAPWPIELIVIDSGSQDDTRNIARALPIQTIVHEITRGDFQHGRTRNMGAEMARGEFLLFLTQDALPADPLWAYKFVGTMEAYPEAAGGFGRHFAYPEHGVVMRDEIDSHFRNFENWPLLVSKFTDTAAWIAKEPGFRRMLHFYSDNNSCMRRAAWTEMPYPEVDYGEDQLWAERNAQRGGGKIYAPNAAVYHSHDYAPDEMRSRARVEASFFAKYFGYDLRVSDIAEEQKAHIATLDEKRRRLGMTREDVAKAQALHHARILGWAEGVAGTSL